MRGFLEDFLGNLKNKDARNTLVAEKILSHNFGKVTVYVTLHDTVTDNWGSQVSSLKKDCLQEKMDTK